MSGPVETEFYTVLGVTPDADEDAIRKGYYKMARKWHPDKRPGPEAEAKFKKITEAYGVLSDPEKRHLYDTQGSDFVDREDVNLSHMLGTLFGGGNFDSVFGDPADIPLLKTVLAGLEGRNGGNALQASTEMERNMEAEKEAREKEEEIEECKKLTQFLLAKVQHYYSDDDEHTAFREVCLAEAEFLANSPGGPELLRRIGYVYRQEGKQHAGRWFGVEGFLEEIAEKKHSFSGLFQVAWQAAKLHSADKQLQKRTEEKITAQGAGGAGSSDEAAAKIDRMQPTDDEEAAKLQQEIVSAGLSTLWKMGLLAIEKRIRLVCELFLSDPEVDKATNRSRAEAVIALGEIFNEYAKQVLREREENKEVGGGHEEFGIPNFEK